MWHHIYAPVIFNSLNPIKHFTDASPITRQLWEPLGLDAGPTRQSAHALPQIFHRNGDADSPGPSGRLKSPSLPAERSIVARYEHRKPWPLHPESAQKILWAIMCGPGRLIGWATNLSPPRGPPELNILYGLQLRNTSLFYSLDLCLSLSPSVLNVIWLKPL